MEKSIKSWWMQNFHTNFLFPVDKFTECKKLCNKRGNVRSRSSEYISFSPLSMCFMWLCSSSQMQWVKCMCDADKKKTKMQETQIKKFRAHLPRCVFVYKQNLFNKIRSLLRHWWIKSCVWVGTCGLELWDYLHGSKILPG